MTDGHFIDSSICSSYGIGGHLTVAMYCLEVEYGGDVLKYFLDDGHIGACNNSGKSFIQFNTEPTKKQYSFIESLVFNRGVSLECDISSASQRSDNFCEYPVNTSGIDVVNDIKAYFLHGSKRLGVGQP